MQDYSKKMSDLFKVVARTDDMRARSDLFKMYKNCKKIYTDLSKEDVECRRTRRKTVKYLELEQKLNESIQEFEQWITFASLLYV